LKIRHYFIGHDPLVLVVVVVFVKLKRPELEFRGKSPFFAIIVIQIQCVPASQRLGKYG
jgi:hypothetical protein